MGSFIRLIFTPLAKPLARIVVGLIAIPIFRLVVRHGFRLAKVEREMEKDLEQWFRASLILLVATANMEHYLFEWIPLDLTGKGAWIAMFFRLLLAIGVIEMMPDQALFGVIHSAPLGLKPHKRICHELWAERMEWVKKFGCIHLNRSSPVFLIMCAIFGGDPGSQSWTVGWVCYGVAVTQYLAIALITAVYKGGDLLSKFDHVMSAKREQLVDEFGEDDAIEETQSQFNEDPQIMEQSR